jgi:hypothetical protein
LRAGAISVRRQKCKMLGPNQNFPLPRLSGKECLASGARSLPRKLRCWPPVAQESECEYHPLFSPWQLGLPAVLT